MRFRRDDGREYVATNKDTIKRLQNSDRFEVIEEKQDNDEDYPKATGGGWYELSNGESIRGKEKAIEAEKELSDA